MKHKVLSSTILLSLFLLAPAALAGVNVGSPAPDFTLPDVNGDLHKLSDFEGKVVLLFFWQST